MKIDKPIQIGQISNDGSELGRVFDPDGVASTLVAGTHGYANYHVLVVEDFYTSRPLRVYSKYAPTLRSDRIGLKVVSEVHDAK